RMTTVEVPFASGERAQVRLVIGNNATGSASPVARFGGIRIFEVGSTPYAWTSLARKVVRNIERKFTTGFMLTLISAGIVLLSFSRKLRTLVIILVVPLYYLTLQSPLHTEYRYILAIHYFLFVLAGASVSCLPVALLQTLRWEARRNSQQPYLQESPGETE